MNTIAIRRRWNTSGMTMTVIFIAGCATNDRWRCSCFIWCSWRWHLIRCFRMLIWTASISNDSKQLKDEKWNRLENFWTNHLARRVYGESGKDKSERKKSINGVVFFSWKETKSQMEMGSARKRNDTTQRRCDSLGDRFRLFICLLFDSQRQRQTQRKSPALVPIYWTDTWNFIGITNAISD